MNLSLCITTYNRYEMTIESFAQVLNDPRIDDIVIMDDCSAVEHWDNLSAKFFRHEKVRCISQLKNVGMSLNKRDSIANAKNEWCILFDSDNIISPNYLNAFFLHTTWEDKKLNKDYTNYIFCPDFAKPNFDYRAFSQTQGPTYGIYNSKDAARCIIDDRFNCLMNTCNYVVNRDFYLKTYQHNPDHKASDTVWHNYNHLKAGGVFAVVPNMQYEHRVHKGSGFMQDVQYNMQKTEEVRKLIQQL